MSRKNYLRCSSYFNAVDLGTGDSLLYNGFTSRIDMVPTDLVRELAVKGGWRSFSFLSPDEIHHLLNRGHLTSLSVKAEREEFKRFAESVFETKRGASRPTGGERAVAFMLTYTCNLSCTYCYQGKLRQDITPPAMDGAFVESFFRLYLSRLFPRFPKKKLSFLLFGGEPLLPGNREAIERILQYAKRFGSGVATATNGVLLPNMLDLFGRESGKIQAVQVTLDGGQPFHDRTRISNCGAPTFQEIIRSIRELMQTRVRTTIRVHLHPEGLEPTRELVDFLEREGLLGHEHINVYFAPITSFEAGKAPPRYSESLSELFRRVSLAQKSPSSPLSHGFARIVDADALGSGLKLRYCTAGTGLLRVVDSLGDVYDCYEEAGNKERRIAVLARGEVDYFKLEKTYQRRHILNMPECLKCSIALYCGGGCLSQAKKQRGSIFKSFCQHNKELVGQTLKAQFLINQTGNSPVKG